MGKQENEYNLFDWWKKVVFKNFANFNGRARRSEYWYYVLANVIIIFISYFVGIYGALSDFGSLSLLGFGVYGITLLVTFIPGLAVAVRRLHDTNRSGWNYLIVLIPLIGPIILLVWFFTEGDKHSNDYGEDPKNPEVVFDFENKV